MRDIMIFFLLKFWSNKQLLVLITFTSKVNFDIWLVSSAPMAELSALLIYTQELFIVKYFDWNIDASTYPGILWYLLIIIESILRIGDPLQSGLLARMSICLSLSFWLSVCLSVCMILRSSINNIDSCYF